MIFIFIFLKRSAFFLVLMKTLLFYFFVTIHIINFYYEYLNSLCFMQCYAHTNSKEGWQETESN